MIIKEKIFLKFEIFRVDSNLSGFLLPCFHSMSTSFYLFCIFRYFTSFFSFPVSVSKDVSEKMQQHKKYTWAKALMEERLSDLIIEGVNIQTHDITDRVKTRSRYPKGGTQGKYTTF